MAPPEIVWTTLPRSIDAASRKLGLSVLVAPNLTAGKLPPALTKWPEFISAHKSEFTFVFNGAPAFPATLDWPVSEAESEALWCRFFEDQSAENIKKSGDPVAVTTNSAGKVAKFVKVVKAKLFGTLSDKLVEHLGIRSIESFQSVSVSQDEIPDQLKPLDLWRGSERRHPQADKAHQFAVSKFDRWLHDIRPAELRAVVERNLFRLADRPYEDLSEQGLDLFRQAMTKMYKINEVIIGRNDELPSPMYSAGTPATAAAEPHHVVQMLAFHRRVRADMRTRAAQTAALSLPTRPFDFHERGALLNGRPAILRAVGLILDFVIDYNGREADLVMGRGTVRVVPPQVHAAGGSLVKATTPRTMYTLVDGPHARFEATGGATLEQGYLKIGKGDYALESIDADGAAFKAVHSVSRGVQSTAGVQYGIKPDASPEDANAPYKVPADRTTGISLIHHQRADHVRSLMTTEAFSNRILNADDLTSGYIVEVKSDIRGNTDFASQMKRTEKHLYAAANEPDSCLRLYDAGEQEGSLRLAVTRATDRTSSAAAPPTDVHAGEALVRWDGWSLAAPRFFGGEPVPPEQPPDDQRPLPWALKSVYRAKPGSLTPLRFGHQYWFRLKGVDLAGNSMTQGPPDAQNEGEVVLGGDCGGFCYRRYEPVPHPIVLLTSPIDHARHPGESLRRLVLTKPVRQFTDEGVERCIIPPNATFRTAEQHGMFDDGVHPQCNSGFDDIGLIAQCDACGNPGWRFEETIDKDPLWVPRREEKNLGSYWPDPMAESLCVRIEDLVSGEYIEIDPHSFYGGSRGWPKAHRIMLRVQHRADGSARIRTAWHHDPTTLVIYLPPSWLARVSISSGLPADRADHMAHFAEWREMLMQATPRNIPNCPSPAVIKKIEAIHHAVTCGCHPMISPCEELIIVHPVEKPLRAPVIDEIRVLERPRGDVNAAFEIDMHFDRKSTGRLDLNASWKETDDLRSLLEPRVSDAVAHVADWPVDTPEKARDFDPLALSSFTPMKPPKPGQDPEIEPVVHQFHDTKYREITYSLRGTSRFKQEFPSHPGDDPMRFAVDSEKYVVTIPSSAPPKKPDVLYVMPSFDWTNEVVPTLEPRSRVYSRRAGGGLRIYMDRGWYSSGAGERLGVVLWPSMTDAQCARLNDGKDVSFHIEQGFPAGAETLSKYVTRWGLDPIWNRSPMPFLPTPHHFHTPKGQHIVYGCKLRLQECVDISNCDSSAIEVSIVSYEPRFDPELGRWYCDIQVHPVPSYNTFIRLALVRYQPNSIAGAELSPVVLADFAQLLPDRAVSVTRVPFEPRTVALQVFGPGNPRNEFEVTVERSCAGLRGQMAWMRDTCIVPESVPGGAEALLSVQITLPQGSGPRRIVIRENERHLADAGPVPPHCDKTAQVAERDPDAAPREVRRLVYADVIEL